MSHRVDLEYIEKCTIYDMQLAGLMLGAERVNQAAAELRELRGLESDFRGGCFSFGDPDSLVEVTLVGGDYSWRIVGRDAPSISGCEASIAEAIAAAREWEEKKGKS